MTRDNRTRGRVAKAAGDNFEVWIEGQNEKAMYLGLLAHVEHNQAQSKIIGGRVVYTGAGVADYTGCLVAGRYLACEAKSTASLRLLRSVIEPKQAAHLDAVTIAGGLALLLVEFRSEALLSERFAVPWQQVPWIKLRSADSVCAADLAAWKIVGQCYLERFCSPGVRVTRPAGRIYPRE